MATANTYTASFSDGTVITRKTDRIYAVAWRATWTPVSGSAAGRVCSETGFSYSRDKVSAYKPLAVWAGRGMSSNERAAAKRANAQHLVDVGYRVEVVEAVKS